MNVRVKFGDSMLSGGRIIRFFAGRTRFFRTFVQYLIVSCSRPEAAIDVIFSRFVGPIVHHKHANFMILA